MGPRKPEIEYINLSLVAKLSGCSSNGNSQDQTIAEAIKNVKKLADDALKKGPYSITIGKTPSHVAASGNIHDFLSYAPYWWPSNDNDGTYIRKDGKRNPDVALVQDQSQLEDLSEQLMFLCIAYQIYMKEDYANHAVHLLDVFFVNLSTKMNPNINYGQVIRGTNNPGGLGRSDGIISTRVLARVANVVPLIYNYPGYARISDAITSWFQQYGEWLLTSDLGRKAAATKNNHASWYMVQIVMVVSTFGLPSVTTLPNPLPKPLEDVTCHFLNKTLPQQIDMKTGDQPLESQRTRPFHYLVFNLQALLYITEWSLGYQQCFGCQDDMVEKAVSYLALYNTDATNEDPTEAVRCVQQMRLRLLHKARRDGDDNDRQITIGNYQRFINKAYVSDKADKISGPQNSLYWLWSR